MSQVTVTKCDRCAKVIDEAEQVIRVTIQGSIDGNAAPAHTSEVCEKCIARVARALEPKS